MVRFPKWFRFSPFSGTEVPFFQQQASGPSKKTTRADPTKSRGKDHQSTIHLFYHNFRSCHPYLTLSRLLTLFTLATSLPLDLSFFFPVSRTAGTFDFLLYSQLQRARFDYTSPSLADPIGDSVANDRPLVSFLTESDPPILTPWRTRKFLSSPLLAILYFLLPFPLCSSSCCCCSPSPALR